MPSPSSLKIESVTSPADLEAVYRLRFGQVGLATSNLEAPESLMFRDMLDTPAATILAAKIDSQIIGTMRMVPRSAGPFIMDDVYVWPQLAAITNYPPPVDGGYAPLCLLSQTALFDRAIVHADFRSSGLLGVMFKHAARIAQTQGKRYIVAAASLDNISIKILLLKGFQEYTQTEITGNKLAIVFARVEDILK